MLRSSVIHSSSTGKGWISRSAPLLASCATLFDCCCTIEAVVASGLHRALSSLHLPLTSGCDRRQLLRGRGAASEVKHCRHRSRARVSGKDGRLRRFRSHRRLYG